MTNEQIKKIALANGFELKEQPNGEMDLNPYVYEFANAINEQNLTKIKEAIFSELGLKLKFLPDGFLKGFGVALDTIRKMDFTEKVKEANNE